MRRAVAAAGWAVLVAGCEQPRTELVARVESEVAWGAGHTVQSVTLTVRRGGPSGPLRSARTTALGVGGERRPLPLLVGIVPTDDTDTPVWIEALGCRVPNGCTAATAAVAQRAVVRFAVGQTQEVPLLLASTCVGVTCANDERCGTTGRCEPATRAVVRPFNGTDAATAMDATDRPMVADASGDAPPVDMPATDTPVSCGPLELRCGGGCVAVSRDSANCGACGRVCPSGQSCADATCAPLTCPSGMRLIPAGTFTMGDADPASQGSQPPHGVMLSAFCMDITEVTVAAYRSCSATGCTAPGTTMFCNWGVAGRDNHPINCVDWGQASAYCQSLGGALPTEAQWEYAARGTDGRTYPWGNDAPASQLCWRGDVPTRQGTCPESMFPSGNSPFGLFDMAGNVWEWTADYYAAYTGSAGSYVLNPTGPVNGSSHVVRGGGSWTDTTVSYIRASYRVNYNFAPSNRGNDVGFRCAHPPL